MTKPDPVETGVPETIDLDALAETVIRLYDQQGLADLLGVSRKTVQNLYSRSPHLLPPAIAIPGARGPRWTFQAIRDWLKARPAHTSVSVPCPPKRKVGRPRIVEQMRRRS